MTNQTQRVYTTLEEITQRRRELEEQIEKKEEKLGNLTKELFSSPPPKSGLEGIVQHAQSAIWAYDGIMTGIRIVKRFQRFFGSKKSTKPAKG
ncbi:MAG: hypothetical protein ACRC3Z_03275 [Phocaeicola sp.]